MGQAVNPDEVTQEMEVSLKVTVTQPGKADREFDSPTQAFSYVASQKGPSKVFWKDVVILTKGDFPKD